MNWKDLGLGKLSKMVALGAYIGVLGILGSPRDKAWANDISFLETVTNTDFVSAGVGGLRNYTTASLAISGIKGPVSKAYLYWHGPMNTDFPLANASIQMDGRTVTGVHIGTSDDNCWGYDNSQAYRADVTAAVAAKRNGTYVLSQFVKQGTNINANGASMLVFFDDGVTNNNRDVVIFEGNDSNAPNLFDALGWNVLLSGIVYQSGTSYLQVHVSDGQLYPDDSVVLNGTVFRARGSIFQGNTVQSNNNGPAGYGNLWDIKTWDISSILTPGVNDLLVTHGYIQHDCVSLVVAAINLPAASAPPPPPPGGTNNAPTITGQPQITVNHPNPILVEALVQDADGDALDYTIAIGSEIIQAGSIDSGVPQTVGTLSLTNAFPLGEHSVVFTVTDGRTNASYTTIVRVIDSTPPVINVPSNIVVFVNPGETTAVVTYVVTATDDFPGEVAIISLPPPGNEFPLGVTTVNISAVDASGNRSEATFTITVTERDPRSLECPGDIVKMTDPGTNVAVVFYTFELPGSTIVYFPPSGSVFPIGTSPVIAVITDSFGNTNTCLFRVTVNQAPPVNQPPTLTGQPDIFVNSSSPLVVEAVAMDGNGDALGYTILIDDVVVQTGTIPAGTPQTTGTIGVTNSFGLGDHLVDFSVTDGASTATYTTVVHVIDNSPPVINVPANIVVPVDPGQTTAVVTYVVTATDDFPGPITITSQPPSGGSFPIGTTTVVVTARDSSGNQSQATFTVTVTDGFPPTITCPADIVRVIDAGTNVAIVNYTVSVTDNLPGVTVVCTPPSGSAFPIGTTEVVCVATDASGNTATCTFKVTINDAPPVNHPPTLVGQPDITINSASPLVVEAEARDINGDALSYTISIDNVVVQTGTIPAGTPQTIGTIGVTNSFGLGDHRVDFSVTDGVNTATYSTDVHVVDNSPPVINVPANIVVPVDPGQTTAVVTYVVTATDDFPGPITVTSQPPSGGTFPIGTTTVVVTARDSSGNESQATFTITVVDDVPPTIVCPPDIIQFTDPGTNNAVVTYVVTATDNLPGATFTCTPPSGSVFPLGTSAVVCTVIDAAGNSASCTFNVTINELPPVLTNRPPVITGQPEITINTAAPSVIEAMVTDDDGNPLTYTIRIDNVIVQTGTIPGGAPQTVGILSVTNAFTLGNHTVIFTADDGNTNVSYTTIVRVIDNTPPVINVPANIVVPVDPGQTTAVVTYVVTATDNFPGNITITTVPPSGGQFPIGTTTVVVTATDNSGNQGSATFTITVVDNVPPTISCPADIIRFTDPGTNVAMVYYTINASDNLPGVTILCTPPSGTVFPIGTTDVVCVATDAAGNTATCSFKVTIKDQPPTLTVPTNMIVAADLGQCSAVVNYAVQVQDNSAGWNLVCTPPSGSTFPAGTTTVHCEVTDAAGNKATNTFTVTVVDNEKPVINLPANITVTAATNELTAVVHYTVTATDNCSTVTLVSTPASGSAFPIGTTIVMVTATDASGNVATGSFTVTVLPNNDNPDNEPPVIVEIKPSKPCLWPPNHKMVNVTFSVKATDNSGKPVTAQIISITSNQPENDLGDGNTEHDWEITGALKAKLRAERSGLHEDRVYTIVIEVKDAAGNVTTGITTVCVPHDMSTKNSILAAAKSNPSSAPVKLVRVVPNPNANKAAKK